MALPGSGQISFADIANELGIACLNIDLRTYSSCAGLSSPDNINELWGRVCTPIYGTGVWSTGGELNVARYGLAGAGTQNTGLAFGGYTNTYVSCTEEYNKPIVCTTLA